MLKKISGYLLVGVVAYFLGTISIIYAEDAKADSKAEIAELTQKVDKMLSNQAEMISMLQYIRSKTH
ncbi:MAG: hypothetical protein JW774_09740 [Candidatus Aureabacteria bacterium]|nr:hypothetical protein [Candidatus Auribacterota bacterium]